MGKVFEWLDRRSGEAVPAYDKRINSLAAFHAGYAFFSSENYHKELSAFAMYAVWNNELNAKLETPLPNGGFMLHCDRAQAFEFLRYGDGYPVFIRLKSKLGRLYAEHLLLSDRDKLFDLYYNGCEVIPPECTCFRHYKAPNDPHFNEAGEDPETEERMLPGTYTAGSRFAGSFIPGSYRRRRNFGGSFRLGGFIGFGGNYAYGSYRGGLTSYRSFSQFGSYRFWGNLTGSYRSFYGSYGGALGSFLGGFFGGSFRLGRYSLGSFFSGSYRLGSYSIGSYLSGGYGMGSYRAGSYSGGSYYGGSYHRNFYNGSYYGGSYHRGSYVYGGCAGAISANEDAGYVEDIMFPGEDSIIVLRGDIPIRRLIEEMGYGLDLI